MEKSILQYQKAFNSIVERLKSNDSVLAVMVFGSMVTGDLWDESDIDLFVIVDQKMNAMKNIYTEEKGVPVHSKVMSKSKFLVLYEEDLRGGFIHRVFASSRLVFSKDADITNRYDNGRFYPDLDRERWNMVYLGNLLKSIGLCRKYIQNEGIFTAYTAAVKSMEEYAKLYVNSSGYMISKDAMTMAMNLSSGFKSHVENLFFNMGDKKEVITAALSFVQGAVDDSIRNYCGVLIDFMNDRDSFLSAEDVENDKVFNSYSINMEEILNKLWEKNIIKKDTRDYKSDEGKVLFKENVYFL
ncbi:MAG: nucleotidyltransferase [Firmicutes bacterium]|nr:nucleotidyltransferase [Bacillota bacterium]